MHINIKNWTKFQHYKDRRPKWIKLLIEIIDEFDADGSPKKFHTLPDSAKLTFVLLVCLRANYNEHIPYPSSKWLRTRLGITKLDLQPLVDKGFICIDTGLIQDDTELIRNCPKRLPPERETERERETYTKEKERYLDFVLLTPKEYWTLLESFGEKGTKDRIVALNNYIGSKGKKYKSHYHTILSWERRHEREGTTKGQRTGASAAGTQSGKESGQAGRPVPFVR